MPSVKSIKQHIRSVQNTSQITKAMEVVSATKMRKSQEFALRARPYAVASFELLHNLLERTPTLPLLLQSRPVKKSALLIVASDKGLAGALNANILRKADAWQASHHEGAMLTIGKKAKEYAERKGMSPVEHYAGCGDFTDITETVPIADRMIKGFLEHEWDELDAVYTNFRTTLVQEAVMKKILPVTQEGIQDMVRAILPEYGKYADTANSQQQTAGRYFYEYIFEPSAGEILNTLLPQLLRLHIHHIILEANASEHSARMIAMKTASDNARELIGDLTREYNKIRQAGITRELAEITAGKEALAE